MRTYAFIIGTTDDFESHEELLTYVESLGASEDAGVPRNHAVYVFDTPESFDEDTVTLIGRGIAFSNDWCMDGSVSLVVEHVTDEDEEAEQ
tara:strand:- start:6523 stop:6795 length:273 start_codon:yes stop_codon:yes gene_type:complete